MAVLEIDVKKIGWSLINREKYSGVGLAINKLEPSFGGRMLQIHSFVIGNLFDTIGIILVFDTLALSILGNLSIEKTRCFSRVIVCKKNIPGCKKT
jgi:hypothetical protein